MTTDPDTAEIEQLRAELEKSHREHVSAVLDDMHQAQASERRAVNALEMVRAQLTELRRQHDIDAQTCREALDRVEELTRERDEARDRVAVLLAPPDYGIDHKLLCDWVNSLPEPYRTYVMRIETSCDETCTIREAICQRQNAEALAVRVRELERERDEALRAAQGPYPGQSWAGRAGELAAEVDLLKAQRDRLLARHRESRQLLVRFVKYAREDRAETPGKTRLERLTAQVDDYLRRTGDPNDILRTTDPAPETEPKG